MLLGVSCQLKGSLAGLRSATSSCLEKARARGHPISHPMENLAHFQKEQRHKRTRVWVHDVPYLNVVGHPFSSLAPNALHPLITMVVFNVKESSDGDAFLYETTTDALNDDLIASLVAIHNGRIQARVVVDAIRGLAADGPMEKPSSGGGGGGGGDGAGEGSAAAGEIRRSGNGPDPDQAEALLKAATELEDYTDKAQAQKRIALTEQGIAELLGSVRGAVEMAYPKGLPDWDLAKVSLEDSMLGLKDTPVGAGLLDKASTSLWVAGKEFERGQLISDRLGKNEKTRVVAKLQKGGDGPPTREPIVRDDERQAMLEYHHKRQEDLKRLAENDEDEYMNSAWADPKNMKRDLQGLGAVRAPGLHRFG